VCLCKTINTKDQYTERIKVEDLNEQINKAEMKFGTVLDRPEIEVRNVDTAGTIGHYISNPPQAIYRSHIAF